MNREEAIYQLQNNAWIGNQDEMKKIEEAVSMAVEALEFLDKYDEFWEAVKFAGNQGREVDIHHGGRLFKIREVAQ